MHTEPSSFGQAIDRASTAPLGASLVPVSLGQVPLFHAACLFAFGIALAHFVWMRPSFLLIALVLSAVLCVLAAFRAQRILWLPLALLWIALGSWCALMEPQPAPAPQLAALSDGLSRTVEGTIIGAGPLRNETEEDLDNPALGQNPSQGIDLRVSTLEVVTDDADLQSPVTGNVHLTIRWPQAQSSQPAPQPFQCGDRLRAQARLLPPETYHDPGVWSREDYLVDQGITSTATVSIHQVEFLGPTAASSLTCRLSAWQHISTAHLLALPAAMRNLPAPLRLTPEDAAMLAAMVAGDRTYLTHSLRVGFERTGSFHMLVVSGFHLAIVAACILWAARRMRIPRVPATLLTILMSFAYALFTGFATPVQRSLWMVTLYLLGRLVYRQRSPLNTIGFAALCLLAVSPRSLFDAGLQMTLLAVVAIAGIAAPLLANTIHPYLLATRDLEITAIDVKLPPAQAHFREVLRIFSNAFQELSQPKSSAEQPFNAELEPTQNSQLVLTTQPAADRPKSPTNANSHTTFSRWPSHIVPFAIRSTLRVVELLVVSCVVELAMALPMALYFHRITLFALPVNLFILPLLVILMPAALLTLCIALISSTAATVPAIFAAIPLHIGTALVRFFGSFTLGDFRIPAPLFLQSAAFCALFAVSILSAGGNHRQRRAACIALLLAAIAAVAPRPIQHSRNAMLVEAIDVGQGDSLLLITPDGKTLLIDAGGFGGGPHQAPQDFDIGEEVVSQALWSRGIRHLDAVALTHAHSDHMGGLPAVLRNFHPDELWVGNNPPRYGPYNDLLAQAASLHIQLRSFHAGDAFNLGSAQIAVLAPFSNYQPGSEPTNNDSLVLHAAYGATSVLLEGDAEAPIEQAMLSEPGLTSSLLKVGHHGSLTSTRPEFLARVAPQFAVISCGLHNRYSHPRPEVLQALAAIRARTYSTDITGAACFNLNGTTVTADPTCGWQQAP